jgi:hypothetical protein
MSIPGEELHKVETHNIIMVNEVLRIFT